MKKIWTWMFVVVLLASCDRFSGSQGQLSRAESFIEKGEYSAAAITLRTLVGKDAGNGRAQFLLAKVQRLRGDTASATAALDAAAKSGADASQVAALRAELLLDQRQYQGLLGMLAAGSPLPASQQQRLKARALLGLGQSIDALVIVDELLKTESAAADVLLLAAECHAALGRQAQAMLYVDKALAADPKSPRAWLLRSASLQAADPTEASNALTKAMTFAPGKLGTAEQVAVLLRMANAAVSAEDVEAAKGAHARLLELAPQSPLAVILGTQIELLEGKTSDAVAELQRLVQRAPDLPQVRATLVGALLANGSFELALHELSGGFGPRIDPKRIDTIRVQIEQAAAAKSDSDQQVLKTAAAALALEQFVAARQITKRALKARPDSIPLALAAQQLQLRTGQVEQALRQAEALSQRKPDLAVMLALAEAQAASGDYAAAASSYGSVWEKARSGTVAIALSQARVRSSGAEPLLPLTQWLADHPQDALVRMALADSARQLGQIPQAIAEYEKVVAQQPQNAIALNNLAGLYQQQRDARAMATAKRAYDLAAKLAPVADTYGWILTDKGDVQAAVPILRAAVAAAPAAPDIRYHLGVALARVGTTDSRTEARILLTDVLRDQRPFPWRPDAERVLAGL